MSRKGRVLRRVLFVGRDNLSVSRFCEEYFNSLVRNEGLNWQASSRAARQLQESGIARQSMSDGAIDVLRELRAAPVNHRRAPATLAWRDVAMTDVLIAIGVRASDLGRTTGGWLLSLPVTHWERPSADQALEDFEGLARRIRLLVASLDNHSPDPVGHRICEIGGAEAARNRHGEIAGLSQR
jgi:hypothetical protein